MDLLTNINNALEESGDRHLEPDIPISPPPPPRKNKRRHPLGKPKPIPGFAQDKKNKAREKYSADQKAREKLGHNRNPFGD